MPSQSEIAHQLTEIEEVLRGWADGAKLSEITSRLGTSMNSRTVRARLERLVKTDRIQKKGRRYFSREITTPQKITTISGSS